MGTRRTASPPPDRLAAVLGEVDRARRGGWVPEESSVHDERGRRTSVRERGAADSSSRGRHQRGTSDTPTVRPHAPLVRTPSSLQGAQVEPSRLALVAVLVLVVAAAVVLGGRMMWVRTMAQPEPARGLLASATSTSTTGSALARDPSATAAPSGGTRGAGTAATSAPTVLLVHVVGQVHRPGVVRLAPGARVQDAVSAAGGATDKADLTHVNLARPVLDGEQVVVPRPGEEVTPAAGGPVAPGSDGGASVPTAGGGSAAGPVDLNSADEAALDSLPGVGPVIAQRIVQWRTDNGRFTSVDELTEVSGIGDKLMAQLRPLVRV